MDEWTWSEGAVMTAAKRFFNAAFCAGDATEDEEDAAEYNSCRTVDGMSEASSGVSRRLWAISANGLNPHIASNSVRAKAISGLWLGSAKCTTLSVSFLLNCQVKERA